MRFDQQEVPVAFENFHLARRRINTALGETNIADRLAVALVDSLVELCPKLWCLARKAILANIDRGRWRLIHQHR
ncbi:hypothetical protein D3C86_2109830 [compost metagenome]